MTQRVKYQPIVDDLWRTTYVDATYLLYPGPKDLCTDYKVGPIFSYQSHCAALGSKAETLIGTVR